MGPMRSPARVLGWFSVGLGLIELLMPRVIARAAGMPSQSSLVRGYGLREIAVGVGLLTSRNPQPWLWGRVVGDALDIVTLSTGPSMRPSRTLLSVAFVAGIAAIDVQCARAATPKKLRGPSRYDYSMRSGFPKPVAEMRGAANRPLPVERSGQTST
jgi:hypothetical protein